MEKPVIDREKLRVAVLALPEGDLVSLMSRAIDELIPDDRLPDLIRDYLNPEKFRWDGTAPASLLSRVQAFHEASCRGDYFEYFDVNWKNCTQKSRGTQVWISECHRLLEQCMSAVATDQHTEARAAFELIFSLLDQLNDDPDSIIFFADEAGAWQVMVQWEKVLPSYFTCLSHVAEPAEFALAVLRIVDGHVNYDRNCFLEKALSVATTGQAQALEGVWSRRPDFSWRTNVETQEG